MDKLKEVEIQTILLIDDDQELREIVVRILEKSGEYSVLEASSGK